jgi:hypothetical protein
VIYLGIDPGVAGGVAMIDDDARVLLAVKMPATERDLISFGQPVTLAVAGTLSDGSIFEVARDPAFTRPVRTFTYSRRWCGSVGLTCVLVGANGQQTSLQLGTYDEDDLTDGDYYWHADASATGVFSPTFQFTLLAAPAPATSTR